MKIPHLKMKGSCKHNYRKYRKFSYSCFVVVVEQAYADLNKTFACFLLRAPCLYFVNLIGKYWITFLLTTVYYQLDIHIIKLHPLQYLQLWQLVCLLLFCRMCHFNTPTCIFLGRYCLAVIPRESSRVL